MKNNFYLKIFRDCFVYTGCNLKTELHRHFLISIIISTDYFIIKEGKKKIKSKFCIIPANYLHELDTGEDEKTILIYIEPDNQYFNTIKTEYDVKDNVVDLNDKNLLAKTKVLFSKPELPIEIIDEFLNSIVKTKSPYQINKHVLQTFSWIEENLYKEIIIKNISNNIYISESRLRYLFKKEVGVSISKFIKWKRMKSTGMQILKGNNFTMASYYSGFYDPSHFNKTFKEMFGINPSKVLK